MSYVNHDWELSPFLFHRASSNDSGTVDSSPSSHGWITSTPQLSGSGVKDMHCKKLGEVNIRVSSTFGSSQSNAAYHLGYELPQGLNNVSWEVVKDLAFSGTQNLKFCTRASTGDSVTSYKSSGSGAPLLNDFSHIVCILGT